MSARDEHAAAGGGGGGSGSTGDAAGPARVHLVGAGPGDPGLMTARALELVARADVVLFDKLIPDDALAGARADAELIDVGKIGGGRQVPQDVTTALLLEHAQAGREVVRLKGGDPFVFGRGGEEAQALAAAGIPFTVVPGVTAGVAASAYAGIPVTQRGVSSAVAFVTGHTQPTSSAGTGEERHAPAETAINWPALAQFPGTLVFYMGVRQLPRIAAQLIAAGRSPDEPAAVVERGTFGDQRSLVATLATVADRAAAEQIRPPSITVIGDVAALGPELAWRPSAPLIGRTVAVTRARAQASALAGRLRALGARVVETPAIRIEPLPVVVPDLASYDLLCVTSPNGAARLLEEVRDARALAGPAIAAIGPGTARALAEGGIAADIVPERAVAESLLEALRGRAVGRVLIARAQEARDLLPDGLRARGAQVDVLALYRTVAEPLDEEARAAVLGAEYLTFASASAARFTHAAAGGTLAGPRLVSIGPVTSDALRALGFPPDVEAAEHTPDGLVAALVADAERPREDGSS